MSLTADQRRIRLLRRQSAMRFRQSEKPRKGWPKGMPRTNKSPVSASSIRFALGRLLEQGKTPKEAAALVKEHLGVPVVVEAIERWRKSAYTSWT